MRASKLSWALPGVIFCCAFTLSAACSDTESGLTPGACSDHEGGGGAGAGGDGAGGDGEPEITPQEVAARIHGCRKIRYQTLGTMLAARGVAIATSSAATPPDAGTLYQNGAGAFSFPKVDSRTSEKDGHTTASAMKLFDIFVQAAPEIIANIDNAAMAPACELAGQTFPMFDTVDGSCVEEAVSCLIGSPASAEHLTFCNLILDKADKNSIDGDANGVPDDLDRKRIIAVATLLSAAHSCE